MSTILGVSKNSRQVDKREGVRVSAVDWPVDSLWTVDTPAVDSRQQSTAQSTGLSRKGSNSLLVYCKNIFLYARASGRVKL